MTDPAPEPWMWAKIKRLVYDENYAEQIARGVVGMLGTLTLTGALVAPELSGRWRVVGVLIAVVLQGSAWWVRAGDKTLRTLAETPDEQLHEVGVATRPIPGDSPQPPGT